MTDDLELARKAKHGDVQAFGLLVERYKERAFMTALGLVGSPEDAMDLSQDAFVKAFRNMRSYKEHLSFYPWFYAILRNTCFSFLRRRKIRKESSLDAARDVGFDVPDRAERPDAALERREKRQLVLQGIRELDPAHREILLLRHYEDLTYKQIAEILGCPIGTVMSRLYAARRALAARIRPGQTGTHERQTAAPRRTMHQGSAEGGRR